jgi:hypothetical protein
MVSHTTTAAMDTVPKRSFADILHASCDIQISQLPCPVISGGSLSIKITQHEYELGLEECKKNLHGRLMLNKGDKPLTTRDLKIKLTAMWNTINHWRMVSLGRGYYEFQFTSYENMRMAWSSGTVNLRPEILRLSKWTNDFNSHTQRQTHAQIWIRLMELPQEYWRQHTLFEIASAIGTPLMLDEATLNRTFGHYARVLVDMDLSQNLFDEILVEREGFKFNLAVVYERLPNFCCHCHAIGHDISVCKWIHPPLKEPAAKKMKQETLQRIVKKEYVSKAIQNQSQVFPAVAKVMPQEPQQTEGDIHKQPERQEPLQQQPKQQTAPELIVDQCKQTDTINSNRADAGVDRHSSAFSMPLQCVIDAIEQAALLVEESLLQRIEQHDLLQTPQDVEDLSDEEEEMIRVPETQITRVVNDEEFADDVQKELQVVKQLWADMTENEKPFTPFISMSQKKKEKQRVRSAAQPYHTRSKGAPPHRSQ